LIQLLLGIGNIYKKDDDILKDENGKKEKIELVIFDMDGTMLDTEPLSMAGWHYAAQTMEIDISAEVFATIFEKMLGTNAAACKAVLKEHLGENFDTEKGYDLHLAHIDEHFKLFGVPLKKGLLPLLDKLEKMNIKKCVATSTAKERATHKLKLANLAHRFEVIIGGDEVSNSKPDPQIFLKAAKACNVAPENCLVLEDSAAGTEGGFCAGMRVITIPDMLPPSEKTRQQALMLCNDLLEVALYLDTQVF